MDRVRFVGYLISLFSQVTYFSSSVNAENNSKISTNSMNHSHDILSKLKALPLGHPTEAIREYDNKSGSNFFGDIIIVAESVKDALSPRELSEIIRLSTDAFCIYVKNLENPDNTDFKKNEETLKNFISASVSKLSTPLEQMLATTTPDSPQKTQAFWPF